MLKALFFFFFLIGAGIYLVFRGRNMIKTRFAANSRKSAFYTGVTHVEGTYAVVAGWFTFVMGIVFNVVGAFGIMGVTGLAILGWADSLGRPSPNRTVTQSSTVSRSSGRPIERNRKTDPASSSSSKSNRSTRPSAAPWIGGTNNDKHSPTAEGIGTRNTGETSSKVVVDLGTREVGKPSESLPAFVFKHSDLTKSDLIGFGITDEEMSDGIVTDRVLVGMVVGQALTMGKEIKNIQPIYQQEAQYIKGHVFGEEGGERFYVLLAPEGYVVSGLKLNSGVSIQALQLIFMKLGEDGKLKTGEQELSDWVGKASGRSKTVFADGMPAISVLGGTLRKRLVALGLIGADALTMD